MSATSPLASTISHPYAEQFATVFCDASSESPLLEHTMICLAPCRAIWMARLPQRPVRPLTISTHGDSPSEMTTFPTCRPLRMSARADWMLSKLNVVIGWTGFIWPVLTKSNISSKSLVASQFRSDYSMRNIPCNQWIRDVFHIGKIHRPERAVPVKWLHRQIITIPDVFLSELDEGSPISADSPRLVGYFSRQCIENNINTTTLSCFQNRLCKVSIPRGEHMISGDPIIVS